MKLEAAVERFAGLTRALRDADLERAWAWGDYDEGVRYAFFRTYEELSDLAASIAAERLRAAMPLTPAQHILGQYIAAYWDMKAALLGVDDTLALQAPAENEWPLRRVLLHVLGAERTFFAILVYAIERARLQDGLPLEMSDEEWERFWAADPADALQESGTFTEIMAYFSGLHARVLNAFVDLRDAELAAPSVYWESTPMPVRFRLHRFHSHMRQHTIQMDKARARLEPDSGEALRLLRMLYAALAQVLAAALGAGQVGLPAAEALAAGIEARCDELAEIFSGESHARPPD